MPDASPVLAGGLKGNFQAYEQDIRVRNYQLCGILAVVFMLAGSSLDWVVFQEEGVKRFFPARVLSAVVSVLVWLALTTAWGKRMHRLLGLLRTNPELLREVVVSIAALGRLHDFKEIDHECSLQRQCIPKKSVAAGA